MKENEILVVKKRRGTTTKEEQKKEKEKLIREEVETNNRLGMRIAVLKVNISEVPIVENI